MSGSTGHAPSISSGVVAAPDPVSFGTGCASAATWCLLSRGNRRLLSPVSSLLRHCFTRRRLLRRRLLGGGDCFVRSRLFGGGDCFAAHRVLSGRRPGGAGDQGVQGGLVCGQVLH